MKTAVIGIAVFLHCIPAILNSIIFIYRTINIIQILEII